jgi:GNAT superfamily N-acetyltransferase
VIHIRNASPEDFSVLQKIYASCIGCAHWLPEEARGAPVLAEVSMNETISVAVNDASQILGFISVQPDDPFVHHLYISSDAQGNGVGAMLLKSLDAWLPKPWRLKCVRKNDRALKFYACNGWVEVDSGESEHGAYALLSFG